MTDITRITKLSVLAFILSLVPTGCGGKTEPAPAALPIVSERHEPSGGEKKQVDIETPTAYVRITVPAAGTFRVRLSQSAEFPEIPSYAVEPAALASGSGFTVDSSDPAAVVVRTARAALRVAKDPLELALLDGDGNVIAKEAAPIEWQDQGATVSWALQDGEHVYGLGDKTGGLDRVGHRYSMWNTDHYQWTVTGPGSDPLYKSIPTMVFVKEGGEAHGLFIDNPSRAEVDVGLTERGRLTYAAERASTMDLYLIAGPDPKDVIGAYTALTGRTALPQRWSLGYNQCRFSYTTEQDAREVAEGLRAYNVPADSIWMDIHYQEHYAPFTVDPVAFPNFTGMIADFAAMGLNSVLITDLHIRQKDGDWQYESGLQGDHYVHNPDGTLFTGNVWPGNAPAPYAAPSVFPEFTLSSARQWWGGLYTTFVSYGVAGFWNDMNEPSVFNTPTKTFFDETPHRLEDGTTADHVTVHNAYGLLNARATFEGLLALRPNVRPFVLARAAYAGSQRWGTTWTGDNTANRGHLAITIPQLVNLGVSGYANSGADVGGYSGCPYFETANGIDSSLLVEWMELGALQPYFRNHSEFGTCRREPWLLGPVVLARLRKAIERRYKLLPYIYTAFEESSRNGMPVMRPLWLEYPTDTTTLTNEKAYLLGRDLLIAPKLVEGDAPYVVTLPQAAWWDTRTGALIPNGGNVTITPPADDSIRIFTRAGAIVPSQPVAQTAGNSPQGALTLDVWPSQGGQDCSGSLYQDDGSSFDYKHGATSRVTYACEPSGTGIKVTSASTGSFPNWWSSTRLLIHGARTPTAVTSSSNTPLPWSFDGFSHTLEITLDGEGSKWTVQTTWSTEFTVTPATASVDVGDTVSIATSAIATWSSDHEGVCTVENGVIRGVSPGTCQVTAISTADTTKTATISVTVTPYTFVVAQVPPDLRSVNVRDEVEYTSTRRAIWTTNDSGICTVDSTGITTGRGVGICEVTAQSPIQPTSFRFQVQVVPRPVSRIVDDYGVPRNVYVKGDFPNFPAVWSGFYENMMRLSADDTWQWTWTFDQASAGDRIFKFVGDRGTWPLHQMFDPKPGTAPGPNGLSGLLKDEASIAADGETTANIAMTVEAGTYLFTLYESINGEDPHYTIVKQ